MKMSNIVYFYSFCWVLIPFASPHFSRTMWDRSRQWTLAQLANRLQPSQPLLCAHLGGISCRWWRCWSHILVATARRAHFTAQKTFAFMISNGWLLHPDQKIIKGKLDVNLGKRVPIYRYFKYSLYNHIQVKLNLLCQIIFILYLSSLRHPHFESKQSKMCDVAVWIKHSMNNQSQSEREVVNSACTSYLRKSDQIQRE